MEEELYLNLNKAKNNKDIALMKQLYNDNKEDYFVKLEYAKLLTLDETRKKEGLKLLIELLNTKKSTYAHLEIGKLAIKAGKFDVARKHFLVLLDTPLEEYALFELGKLECNVGNLLEAKKYFTEVISINNDVYAIYELGRVELELGNFDNARNLFHDVLTQKPNDIYALYRLGLLEAKCGNYTEARKCFLPLLKTKFQKEVMFELGKIEVKIGNYKMARDYFNYLITNYNYRYAILELALLEINTQNFNEAKKNLSILINNYHDEHAFNLLCIIEYKLNNYLEVFNLINEYQNMNVSEKVMVGISKKLNVFFAYDYEKTNNYGCNMILNYDEESAISHIFLNHVDSFDKNNFNKNIDIYKLFINIKKCINANKKVNYFTFYDIYFIDYPNIGENGEKYLKVITLPNSDEIITMYPVSVPNISISEKDENKQVKILN